MSARVVRAVPSEVDVTPPAPLATRPAGARRVEALASSIIRDILRLTRDGSVLSLAGGLPAREAFPVDAVAQATRHLDPDDLQYAPTEGLEEVRAWIASRLRAAGRDLGPDDVLVTSGSQQALSLVATALVDPGDVVAIEEPGYLGAIQALTPAEPDWRPVPVDAHGLQVDRLPDGPTPRLAYVATEASNPSGLTLPTERREALGRWADHAGTVVVEDRAYDGLDFARGPLAPSVGAWTDRVLTVGTVSKTLAPGLRVGWVAGPADLLEPIRRAKQAADLQSGTLSQRIVAHLVADPAAFESHVDGVVARHREHAAALARSLATHLGDRLHAPAPTGGMFLWARAPGVDTRAWLDRAVDAGVAFVPGSAFAATAEGASRLSDRVRLSFATLGPDDLDEAAQRLARSLPAA